MITIDIVDDDNERSTRPVIQALLVVGNRRNGSFDAAYESARSFYSDLLRVADQERQASQAKARRNLDVVSTLNRIARALTAWL